MTPRSLPAAARALAGDPPDADADLLTRHLAGDSAAFAALVRRHGRLVWAACRALTRCEAEADDAFQATFLVLLRHARRVRDPAALPAWLHAVAYRVAANARRASARRRARERAAAVPESTRAAVPGAAWDRALAAVHEAVARLPDGQRVPFVLCCLDGLTPAEAAGRLGWKPGTVSSRLARAKDAVLARLAANDLAVGAVAGVGLLTPPVAVASRAAALAHAGSVVPASLLSLTHGAIGMNSSTVKALAAGVLLACGLGGTAGSVWLSAAQAQRPGAAEARPDRSDELKVLRARVAELEGRHAAAADRPGAAVDPTQPAPRAMSDAALPGKLLATFRTGRYEYALVAAGGPGVNELADLVRGFEARGWEYAGTAPPGVAPPGVAMTCVFRRPAAPPAGQPPRAGAAGPSPAEVWWQNAVPGIKFPPAGRPVTDYAAAYRRLHLDLAGGPAAADDVRRFAAADPRGRAAMLDRLVGAAVAGAGWAAGDERRVRAAVVETLLGLDGKAD